MHPGLVRAIAGALSLVIAAPLAAVAQDNGQPPAQAQPAPQAPVYQPAQLDQMLAPIALYPDQLLGQILMASTYPLEVVQADRWVKDPNNAALKGDQLAAALQPIDWDPSVKSLVPFPQILALMDERVDWTQNLGNAFLAQQADVMDSVQRLRHQAEVAGTLRSTPQETVVATGQTITIQPANPTVIYVPVYNPTDVYGAWLYPDYPPIYLPPPPGFYVGPAIVSGIGFSIGFGIVRAFWGWDDWDWDHRRLHVDANRYNVINNYFIQNDRRPTLRSDNWTHDPYHRRGVVYRDPQTRATFRAAPAAAPDTRRDFRGFATPQASRPPAAQQARPAVAGRPAEPRAAERTAPAARVAPAERVAPAARPAPVAPAQPSAQRPAVQRPVESAQRPAPVVTPRQQVERPAAAAQRPPAVVQRGAPAVVQHAPPPAFQGFSRGADVRTQAERGRASQQTVAPRPTAAAPSRPAPTAAPRASSPPPAASRGAPAGGKGGREKPDDEKKH